MLPMYSGHLQVVSTFLFFAASPEDFSLVFKLNLSSLFWFPLCSLYLVEGTCSKLCYDLSSNVHSLAIGYEF